MEMRLLSVRTTAVAAAAALPAYLANLWPLCYSSLICVVMATDKQRQQQPRVGHRPTPDNQGCRWQKIWPKRAGNGWRMFVLR